MLIKDSSLAHPHQSRASIFTKFCKRLQEFQKWKHSCLQAITVLIFSLSQICKITNIFLKKELFEKYTLCKNSKLFDFESFQVIATQLQHVQAHRIPTFP